MSQPRKTGLVKFRCEPDLVEAVEETARELRISPSEAGRTALKLWLEELERVPHPDRLPSRLVQPVIEIGHAVEFFEPQLQRGPPRLRRRDP